MPLSDTIELLIPTVGFRQVFSDQEFQPLDASLLGGDLSVNAVSEEFLRVEFMSQNLEYLDGQDHPVWDVATSYTAGQKVSLNVNNYPAVWVAKSDNTGLNPSDNLDVWESSLSNRLRNYRASAAQETVNVMISSFTNKKYSRELFNSTVSYMESATATPVADQGRFVGLVIIPTQNKLNRFFRIRQVGLTVNEATTFDIYLYHSSIFSGPFQTSSITVTQAGNFQWHDVSFEIDLYNTAYNQGGVFLLGFYESGLDYSANELVWPFWQKQIYTDQYWRMSSIEIPPERLNGTALPEIGQYYDGISSNSQMSINLRFDSMQSYSELFNANLSILTRVYQYTLAEIILKDMRSQDRRNSSSDNKALAITSALFGEEANESDTGIVGTKQQHIDKLMADMTEIFSSFEGAYAGR